MVNSDIITDPHAFHYHSGYAVNENKERIDSPLSDYTGDSIRINHYVLRSVRDFWDTKVARGQAAPIPDRDQDFFDAHNRNEIFDDEISRQFGFLQT